METLLRGRLEAAALEERGDTAETLVEVKKIASILTSAPGELVDEALKEALQEIIDANDVVDDSVSGSGLSRSIENSYKAIVREIGAFVRRTLASSGKKLEEELSTALAGATMIALYASASQTLLYLAGVDPNTFGWASGVSLWLMSRVKK